MSNFTLHDAAPEIARYVIGARNMGFRQGYNIVILELEGGKELIIRAVGKVHIELTEHGHLFTPPKNQ